MSLRLGSAEAVLLMTAPSVEPIEASSLEVISSMVEVGVTSRLNEVIESKSVLDDSSGKTDIIEVESKSLASVVVAGTSINEGIGLSPLPRVVKV